MKKYLRTIILFFLPIVVLFISAEIVLRKTKNIYSYKSKQIKHQKEQIEILVLGSSNALYGINPKYFQEKGFNLSFVSQSLDIDELILDHYTNELPKLKFIVLTVDYISLYYDLKNNPVEYWRLYDYFHFMDLDAEKLHINRWSPHSQSLIIGKGFKNSITKLISIFSENHKVSTNAYGWGTNYANREFSEKEFSEYGKITAQRHSNTICDVQEKKETLKRIVAKVKKRGIDVFIITLPTSKFYRDYIQKSRMEEAIVFFDSIAKTNDHVFYYNYFSDSSFVNKDFHDANHLNHRGSEKISKMIFNQIRDHD